VDVRVKVAVTVGELAELGVKVGDLAGACSRASSLKVIVAEGLAVGELEGVVVRVQVWVAEACPSLRPKV